MITSDAPPETIAKIRHLAGPAPEGCRITHNERLHLIWMLATMVNAAQGGICAHVGYATIRSLREQLNDNGLSSEDISGLFSAGLPPDPILMADTIAVHPSLRGVHDDYLD